MKRRFGLFGAILFLFLIIAFGNGLIRLYTDWIWFMEAGYAELFTIPLTAKILLGFGTGIVSFILLILNVRLAAPGNSAANSAFRFVEGRLQVDAAKYIRPAASGIMALLSLFTGLAAAASWDTVLKYVNATSFGVSDPIFNRDIGFYIFTLPFVQLVVGFIFWILIVAFITAALLYGTRGSFIFLKRAVQFDSRARAHLFSLIAAFFILAAVRTWYIKIPNLLFGNHEIITGAGYANLHADLPLLKILAILALTVALLSVIGIVRRKTMLALYAVGAYIAVAVIGQAYPLALQRFIVAPNELVKESEPIEHNIAATRAAYGLDAIETRNLDGDTILTGADIANNRSTINNIRLWDREPLLDTFGQLQEIRTYYDFISVDNDRYYINGDYRQILLSPRELDATALPSRTFINERLSFTHGYGLTLAPVNEVTPEGLPLLFVKDIPPVSSAKDLEITRPEIYYGELANDPVFVNTRANEFDYPSGEENVFATYDGKGGVPVQSVFRKALLALRFKSLKIFLSADIQNTSRVMYYRDIRGRARRVLPFLRFDKDPYMVITENGRLKWIQDAYTISDRYPYSEFMSDFRRPMAGAWPVSALNYIRNSVKIVTDAYDGSMSFYISDPSDPLIKTYAKIFPSSFAPLAKMPDDLRAHLRYPEDLFHYQTALYAIYHMQEAQIFYNKEDAWHIPSYGSSGDPMMRHLIMKLPGNTPESDRETDLREEEFILMIPFTPKGKDNLAAWMVARSDGEDYGKLVVYRFPKQKLVFGPTQIVNRINQDAEISRQISLWDQRGSEVIHGNLLVIPIEESLLYVQPLYLRAEGGRIPELKRVIVAYENQIAMEQTLDTALYRIFGSTSSASPLISAPSRSAAPSASTPAPQAELLRQARAHYDAALAAQRQGDWTRYGEEIKKLGGIINQLQ